MKGNLSLAMKVENERFLQHFVGTPQTSFGADIGNGIRLVQADVFLPLPESELEGKIEAEVEKVKKGAESQTICEIDVTKSECYVFCIDLFCLNDSNCCSLHSLSNSTQICVTSMELYTEDVLRISLICISDTCL